MSQENLGPMSGFQLYLRLIHRHQRPCQRHPTTPLSKLTVDPGMTRILVYPQKLLSLSLRILVPTNPR